MVKMKEVIKLITVAVTAIMITLAVGAINPESAKADASVNSKDSGTWCWVGVCGHPYKYITYYVNSSGSRYYVTKRSTDYEYLGKYIDAGNSASISKTVSFSISFTAGAEAGIDICKASTSVTSGIETSWSYTDTLNNNTSTRKYVHAGVEWEERRSYGVGIKTRTYYPFYDLFGFSNYCKYSETKNYYPIVKVPTGEGYTLLSSQKTSSLISYR
ncbi:MAG: hypothetical protein ACI4EU_06715 [Butyrivibrio sp.]